MDAPWQSITMLLSVLSCLGRCTNLSSVYGIICCSTATCLGAQLDLNVSGNSTVHKMSRNLCLLKRKVPKCEMQENVMYNHDTIMTMRVIYFSTVSLRIVKLLIKMVLNEFIYYIYFITEKKPFN